MKIYFDGEEEIVEEGTTVADFVLSTGNDYNTIVVDYNYEELEREKWPNTVFKENDSIELFLFLGGG